MKGAVDSSFVSRGHGGVGTGILSRYISKKHPRPEAVALRPTSRQAISPDLSREVKATPQIRASAPGLLHLERASACLAGVGSDLND